MIDVQAPHDRSTTVHHQEAVMGTVVTIDLFCRDGLDVDLCAQPVLNAVRVLHEADLVFSTWKSDSPISRLRRGEITIGDCPPVVAEVLDICRTAMANVNGWFNPWALDGGVDPTGLVKGWAAERALDELRAAPVDGAMVNASGDIASFGGLGDVTPFNVGIVQPNHPDLVACVVELRGALATSGTYERGQHLRNPFLGTNEVSVASASVTGPDLAMADAFATALAVGGPPVMALIDQIPSYEAFTIGLDGAWSSTEKFPFIRGNSPSAS